MTESAGLPRTLTLRKPGLYPDVSERDYHADGALSSSQARALLDTVPAQWVYDVQHPPEPTDAMEFGSAVHSLTLGVGAPVVEVRADAWRKNADKELRAEVRAEGGIPLLTKDYRRAKACALAVLRAPKVGRMIRDAECEISGWWRDPETGVMCRLRVDALYTTPSGDTLALDLKTADTADPAHFAAAIRSFGYHRQEDYYDGGLVALDRPATAGFLFPVVARKPPHLVSLNRIPRAFVEHAHGRNRAALELYAACSAANDWPDYRPPTIHEYPQPAWAYKED